MRENPYAAVPLLDPANLTLWYPTITAAEFDQNGVDSTGKPARKSPDEAYDIQYRPGRKAKVRK
jgi:hypothetical protein